MVLEVRLLVKFREEDVAVIGSDHRKKMQGADNVLFFELYEN